LASELGAGSFDAQELASRLTRILDANPNLHSLGVAYAPDANGAGQRFSARYFERRGGELHLLQMEHTIDTTSADHRWFVEAMVGEAGWREPIWDDSLQALTTIYSAPFPRARSDERQGAAGVVWRDHGSA
jgi:hypothetical protein